MLRLTLAILPLCLFAATAMADTSVWDQARQASNERMGKIVFLASDGGDIVIRVANRDGGETFRVCSSFPGGDSMNLIEVERLNLLRTAYERGDVVKVSFGSAFDRCVQNVEIAHSASSEI